jgi:predicted DNA-binding transcriptional regulator AlpA
MIDCPCKYCRRADPDRVNDQLVNEPQAREFLGWVSHMWIRRRLKDPCFAFPKRVELGRRRYFWKSDLAAWAVSPHAALRTERNFVSGE